MRHFFESLIQKNRDEHTDADIGVARLTDHGMRLIALERFDGHPNIFSSSSVR